MAQLCLPFQDLLDPARWRMLIQQFRYDNYRLHQLGNNSVFTLTLQAGLSAIKTPYPSGLCPQPCASWPLPWSRESPCAGHTLWHRLS